MRLLPIAFALTAAFASVAAMADPPDAASGLETAHRKTTTIDLPTACASRIIACLYDSSPAPQEIAIVADGGVGLRPINGVLYTIPFTNKRLDPLGITPQSYPQFFYTDTSCSPTAGPYFLTGALVNGSPEDIPPPLAVSDGKVLWAATGPLTSITYRSYRLGTNTSLCNVAANAQGPFAAALATIVDTTTFVPDFTVH